MKTSAYVEFYGKQVAQDDLVNEVKKIWTESGKDLSEIKSIALYLKPEDDCCYYVVNGSEMGSFQIIDTKNYF
ncbi:MAG: hypothetical protein IKQ49_03080 [Eubacterium sp.]|nr:hypothetical protein [Eubacterium sp.]